MRQINFGIVAVAACLLVSACSGVTKEQAQQMQSTNDSLTMVVLQQTNELAELNGAISDVTSQLDAINGQISVSNGEDGDLKLQRQRLMEKLSLLQKTMQEKQEQLDSFKKKYNYQLSQNKELKKTIERMEGEVAAYVAKTQEYENTISQQVTKIANLSDSLNVATDSLNFVNEVNKAQNEVLEGQDKMLNTGYYVLGSASELKKLGLVEGGIFNKKRLTTKGFDDKAFTVIDIREVSEIALNNKDAKLITSHPADSYELVKGQDKNLKLVIKDPKKFWSNSRYLIVKVD